MSITQPTQPLLTFHRAFGLLKEGKRLEGLEELTLFLHTKHRDAVNELLTLFVKYERCDENTFLGHDANHMTPNILTLMMLRGAMAYRVLYPSWSSLRDVMVEKYGRDHLLLRGLTDPHIPEDLKGVLTPDRDENEVKAHIEMTVLKVIQDSCDILGERSRPRVLTMLQNIIEGFKDDSYGN